MGRGSLILVGVGVLSSSSSLPCLSTLASCKDLIVEAKLECSLPSGIVVTELLRLVSVASSNSSAETNRSLPKVAKLESDHSEGATLERIERAFEVEGARLAVFESSELVDSPTSSFSLPGSTSSSAVSVSDTPEIDLAGGTARRISPSWKGSHSSSSLQASRVVFACSSLSAAERESGVGSGWIPATTRSTYFAS